MLSKSPTAFSSPASPIRAIAATEVETDQTESLPTPVRSANGNLVRTREWHQIKCFHQYLMVRPHQSEWKALHQSKAQWIANMKHYNPVLRYDRAAELFGEHFERLGNGDLWRMRFNRRSANPLEWISVDFFSKGRALDASFLRFLMGMTWQMKSPAFRTAVSLEEFTRDRTEEEDKEAKDTFLLAHRFLYDSCPQGLRLELVGNFKTIESEEDDKIDDTEDSTSHRQQQRRIFVQLKEWEGRGLVSIMETTLTSTLVSLAREALDLVTYDSPLLPSILQALLAQRPEAIHQYRRIIAKEANSRTCFFRLYKNSRFLTLFGPLKPELAALIESAPASYYTSSMSSAHSNGIGSITSSKRTRARGSVYTGFKRRSEGHYAASSRRKEHARHSGKNSTNLQRNGEEDFYYYYDDDDDLGEVGEKDEVGETQRRQRQRKMRQNRCDDDGEELLSSVEPAVCLANTTTSLYQSYDLVAQQPPSSSYASMKTTAETADSHFIASPTDDVTTISSSGASMACLSPLIAIDAETPAWIHDLENCVNGWFPHMREGDDKTLYEPPVDPDDVFEKWCRENMVVSGAGQCNTNKDASSLGVHGNCTSYPIHAQAEASTVHKEQATSPSSVGKYPSTDSLVRSTASSSSSTTVATLVEVGEEEIGLPGAWKAAKGNGIDLSKPTQCKPQTKEAQHQEEERFCSLMLKSMDSRDMPQA